MHFFGFCPKFTKNSKFIVTNFVFYADQVPVGRVTLGRIMNVIGEPIDEKGELSKLIKYFFKSVPYSFYRKCVSVLILSACLSQRNRALPSNSPRSSCIC